MDEELGIPRNCSVRDGSRSPEQLNSIASDRRDALSLSKKPAVLELTLNRFTAIRRQNAATRERCFCRLSLPQRLIIRERVLFVQYLLRESSLRVLPQTVDGPILSSSGLWEYGNHYFRSGLLERFSYLCKLFLASGFLTIAKIQGLISRTTMRPKIVCERKKLV